MLGLDFEAIAFEVDDAYSIARRGRAAARRPFAVADLYPSAIGVDRLSCNDDAA